MKKILTLILTLALVLTAFVSCGTKSQKRLAYDYNMGKYVSLGNYKGIEIDKASETFTNYYDSYYKNDISSNNLFQQIKEGTCKKGDIVNITYSGKKDADGTIFTGDTTAANNDGKEDYNLTLGSGEFITGFEDQLVGAKVGSTVYVKITFPADYSETTLQNAAVTFTVKVNYINAYPELTDEVAKSMGHADKQAYVTFLEEYVCNTLILEKLSKSGEFTVLKYPEEERKKYDEIYNDALSYAEEQAKLYNQQYNTQMDKATMLYYITGMNEETLKEYYDESMKIEMISYAIFDKEGLSYTQEQFDNFVNNMATSEEKTVEEIKKNYEDWALETNMAKSIVMKFLLDNASIK